MPRKRKPGDERFLPLQKHIAASWLATRGYALISDTSDWASVARLLGSAQTLTLQQFTDSWDGFMRDYGTDIWYQRQRPVRFWANNPTRWMRAVPVAKTARTPAQESMWEEARRTHRRLVEERDAAEEARIRGKAHPTLRERQWIEARAQEAWE